MITLDRILSALWLMALLLSTLFLLDALIRRNVTDQIFWTGTTLFCAVIFRLTKGWAHGD